MANKPKRIPKTKEELKQQMERLQRVEHNKKLARLIYPLIQNHKSIYDAQTVLNAAAGYIETELAAKAAKVLVSELFISVSSDKGDKVLVESTRKIIELLKNENADLSIALLKRFGAGIEELSAERYMKNPMNKMTIEDIIA